MESNRVQFLNEQSTWKCEEKQAMNVAGCMEEGPQRAALVFL